MLNTRQAVAATCGAMLTERLRSDTREQHEAIERVAAMQRLFAPDYRLDEYRDLLLRLFGFYAALEPLLFHDMPAQAGSVLSQRRKTQWLEEDLAQLGVEKTTLAAVPLCFALPGVGEWADKLGVFYVLEGSTLGGLVISRRLEQQFDWLPDAAPPLRFYRGYGERSGRQWRAMKSLLDRFGDGGERAQAQVCAAADDTFARLADWLRGIGTEPDSVL